MQWEKTGCCLCLQSCGLEVMIEDNRIMKVRGDKDNPRSRGYVCRKGIKIPYYQHHKERLTSPLMRRNGQLAAVGWEEALNEIADHLGEILQRHGPRSLALMAGASGGCQIGGRFSGRFLFSTGSRYLYTSLGQEWTGRHYVRGRVYGSQPLFLHPDHDQLDLLLALGWNGWSSHGMPQTRRFLKALSEDPDRTLIVVDPRPSETARRADIHLALRPGSDALFLESMISIILRERWHDQEFMKSHTIGWEETTSYFTDFPVDDALKVCGLPFDKVKEVCRLFSTRKSAVMSDLGVLMNRHSTLVSYLEEILLAVCGRVGTAGGNVFTGTLSPLGAHTPPENPDTWHTAHTGIPAIMGIFPPNVLPEEITSGREDRVRALIVTGSNPLRSYADTSAYEKAFHNLELLVVVDVAFTETTALADYVLPARTTYEAHDASFFSFNFPEIFYQLRRPLLRAEGDTRENGWIMTALAERMGLVPPVPDPLCQAAKEDRRRFGSELNRYIKTTPGAALKLPFVLSKTLGPVLGSDHLAFLWGLIWSAPLQIKEAMARAGFPKGDEQTEKVYQAIMDHPQGIWIGRLDPEKNLDFIAHDDGKIHLHAPELTDRLRSVTPQAEDRALTLDTEFPMILVAGWHYDFNANTEMRDPAWNGNRRVGCLAVHPQDAAELGIADGEFVRLTTKAGSAMVEIEISHLTTPGIVILPQGFGLKFNERSVGVNVNMLTHAGHRDPISAVPCHRRVPCRLEKTTNMA